MNFCIGQTFKGKINGVIFRLKKEKDGGFWIEFLNIKHRDVFVSKNLLGHLFIDAV